MSNCKIFSLLVVISIMFVSCSSGQKNKSGTTIWKETVGYLEPAGQMFWIRYECNGIGYRSRFYLRQYGATFDETFTMRYNEKDPNEILIDYWNPIFEKEEKTHVFIAKIKRIVCARFYEPKCSIDFEYKVGGKVFEKTQSLPPNYKSLYPNLKKGQNYEIEVWDEDLLRAVVYLDKPR